jgi:hypothetical protein
MAARSTGPERTSGAAGPGRIAAPLSASVVASQAMPSAPASPVHGLQETLAAHFGGRAELCRQAEFARSIGSQFVAAVLEAGERQLDQAPRTAALIAGWPGDPAAAAMAMRFNAALHAIARRDELPALSALFRGAHDDFDGAIAEALRRHDDAIVAAMAHPTQTNEVGRAGALLAALMVAQRDFGMPFDLLELGSSCGLNLNLARYAMVLDGARTGDPASPVLIAPEWRGARLPFAPVEIASARGVDLNPPDPDNPATRQRMLSFVWADQQARLERLARALDVARHHRPQVDRGSAADWLAARLDEPPRDGVCRAVFHSMVLQYLEADERRRVIATLREAGARACARRPLAWISFEWSPGRREVRLLLTCWPGGGTRQLATCHPYGAWIDWRARTDQPVNGCPDDLIAEKPAPALDTRPAIRAGR